MGHKEHHRMDNFYPRPPRGGRRHGQVSQGNRKNFYPRPPRGGRHNTEAVKLLLKEFLSTPSARRATAPTCTRARLWAYFYPRPPRGGRLAAALQAKVEQLFLSTPSARRATPEYQLPGCAERISIHALREEGDVLPSSSHRPSMYFYPRPPRGGRRRGFLLPARLPPISIHALREEGDADLALFTTHDGVFLSTPSARRATVSFPASCRDRKNFYPRPPRGGRPGQIIHTVDVADISIHALREEGDYLRYGKPARAI